MNFDVIILATLCVVVLFQIIILINQQKNGKLVGDYFAQRAKNFQERGGDRGERFRERNGNRQNRPPRGEQEFKPRTPQAPSTPAAAQGGAVDNVEKSLRDINLKLKNAERDQEVARRKFQDNTEIDGANREQPRRRHSRDSRDGRDNRGGGRDENRDSRRGGGDRDRNRSNFRTRQDRPFQEESPAESPEAEMPETSYPVDAETGPISAPPVAAAAAPELGASDFDSDNTEHGRKFNVRRRMLKEDVPGDTSPSGEEPSSASASAESSPEAPAGDDAEISFGRR